MVGSGWKPSTRKHPWLERSRDLECACCIPGEACPDGGSHPQAGGGDGGSFAAQSAFMPPNIGRHSGNDFLTLAFFFTSGVQLIDIEPPRR